MKKTLTNQCEKIASKEWRHACHASSSAEQQQETKTIIIIISNYRFYYFIHLIYAWIGLYSSEIYISMHNNSGITYVRNNKKSNKITNSIRTQKKNSRQANPKGGTHEGEEQKGREATLLVVQAQSHVSPKKDTSNKTCKGFWHDSPTHTHTTADAHGFYYLLMAVLIIINTWTVMEKRQKNVTFFSFACAFSYYFFVGWSIVDWRNPVWRKVKTFNIIIFHVSSSSCVISLTIGVSQKNAKKRELSSSLLSSVLIGICGGAGLLEYPYFTLWSSSVGLFFPDVFNSVIMAG